MTTATAKTESRREVAEAIIEHAISLCSDCEVLHEFPPGHDAKIRKRAGAFSAIHTTPNHYMAEELVDVWMGRKCFAARRHRGQPWKIVNFKRGDWEMAFLLTA